MTRQETATIMQILRTAYPAFYGKISNSDMEQTLRLWSEMFRDDNVAFVAAAVKTFIAEDVKGFPPHIGAIKNTMHSLSCVGVLDAAQAWELVRKAASRSGYGAQEEFDRLPENIQKIVGSPSQLYEWSQMDSDVFNSVVASNFRKAYQARRESQRRDALLPGDVKRVLMGLTEHMALEAGHD